MYIVCDLYECCSLQHLVQMLPVFVPLLFNILEHDEDPAVQQAAFYCLGLMVSKCKNAATPHLQRILRLCTDCISKHGANYRQSGLCIASEEALNGDDEAVAQQNRQRQFLGVIDNAMATVCKVLRDIDWAQGQQQPGRQQLETVRNEAMTVWFKHLPLKSDTVEGRLCHEFVMKMVEKKHPIVIGQNLSNLPFVLKVFAAIRNTKMSTPSLDQVVAEFAQTLCKSQPQFAQNLSPAERRNLGLQ